MLLHANFFNRLPNCSQKSQTHVPRNETSKETEMAEQARKLSMMWPGAMLHIESRIKVMKFTQTDISDKQSVYQRILYIHVGVYELNVQAGQVTGLVYI
jgi:hypothetical protein